MLFEFTLVAIRNSINKLNVDKLKSLMKSYAKIAERPSNGGYKFEGFVGDIEPTEIQVEDGNRYSYLIKLKFSKDNCKNEEFAAYQVRDIIDKINRVANFRNWTIYDAEQKEKPAPENKIIEIPDYDLPALDGKILEETFAGIYERESHIRLIYDSIKTQLQSGGMKRIHCIAYGEPASAKTEVFLRFKELIERDGHSRMLVLDASTTSKAGLEKLLLERAEQGVLPPFLLIEEIEKQTDDTFRCLLSVMDDRMEISRNNARIGLVKAKTPMTVFATCNSAEIIKSWMKGALWSRFSWPIRCDRPTKEIMKSILQREISKTDGNLAWIEPIIDLGYNKLGTNDPRKLISFLAGGDRLLDGSFQADIMKTMVDNESV